jgi:hypothetical protein
MIRIHDGTSCHGPVGRPLLSVFYTSTLDGRASSLSSIASGLSNDDVVGRVMSVHDHDGDPIRV